MVFFAFIDTEKKASSWTHSSTFSQERNTSLTKPSKSVNITSSVITSTESSKFRIFEAKFFEESWRIV